MRIRALLAALLLALAALVALPAAVSAQEEGDGTQPGAESEIGGEKLQRSLQRMDEQIVPVLCPRVHEADSSLPSAPPTP